MNVENPTNNPAFYRKLSEPHESAVKANEAVSAFFKAVEAARKEYHVPDVAVAVAINVLYEDGAEGRGLASAKFGNWLEAEGLFAYGLGIERAERLELTNKLMAPRKGRA